MAEVDLWRDCGLIPKSPSTNLRDFFEDGGKIWRTMGKETEFELWWSFVYFGDGKFIWRLMKRMFIYSLIY